MSSHELIDDEMVRRAADALATWVNPSWRIGWAETAARVVLEAALGARCGNCDAALAPDPVAPNGLIHKTGDLLCAGHTTVSSDGSNTARRAKL